MSLIPIDKTVDDLISRKAREQNKSKGDILREILESRGGDGQGQTSLDPESLAKALAAIPTSRPGSLAEEMKEMASTMMTIKMMQMMGQQQAAPAPAQHDGYGELQRIMLMKELTKPSIYELMMMEKLGRGEESPKWLQNMAEEQKETREMLKGLLEDKKETEHKQELKEIAETMTASTAAMAENYNKILEYISKGDHAPKDTIEGYIASALKEQLTDRALEAIDKGLFKQEQVITPEGSFNWKEVLNRMMKMGEDYISKIPQRTPPPALLRRMDGTFVNPANGAVLSAQEAAAFMQAASGQGPGVVTQPPPVVMASPPPQPPQPEQTSTMKKKANEVIDQLVTQGEQSSEQPTEQQSSEPSGGEIY